MTQIEEIKPSRPGLGSGETSKSDLNVLTVNVRYDGQSNTPVPIPIHGSVPAKKGWRDWIEFPWSVRRSRLVDCLLSTGPLDIIGFQEVLHNQLLDLQDLLGSTYSHVGIGRDDGQTGGEHSPIFYDRIKFDKVDWKTIWLSKTPDVPGSKDWDSNLTRIATFLTLRRNDGSLIHVINTHYDDQGVKSRAESSYIIRQESYAFFKQVEQAQGEGSKDVPNVVILLGDFNSPTDEDGYGNITSHKPVPSGRPAYTFNDTFTHLETRTGVPDLPRQSAPYGPVRTYTTFGRNSTGSDCARIDFIFLGEDQSASGSAMEKRGKWVPTRYACLDNLVEEDESGWQGRWSDHRAVRVKLELWI